MAGCVLYEHGCEALKRTEGCTVNHHRRLFAVVLGCVLKTEALRQVIVDLNGSELPTASDGVLNHKVELRTIEGCFANLLTSLQAFLLASLANGVLALSPYLGATDIFLGVLGVVQRNLSLVVLEAEDLEHLQDNVDNVLKLFLNLILTNKDVGVVLCERAHTGKTVELTALLVAEYSSKLSNAQWQILI